MIATRTTIHVRQLGPASTLPSSSGSVSAWRIEIAPTGWPCGSWTVFADLRLTMSAPGQAGSRRSQKVTACAPVRGLVRSRGEVPSQKFQGGDLPGAAASVDHRGKTAALHLAALFSAR